MKRKKSFLKGSYSESWNYIKESKNFILASVGIFFLFAAIGFFVPAPEYVTAQIMKFIEELLNKTRGMSLFELVSFIFLNNMQSSFFGLILGIFLGIFPIINSMTNGYLLGFVASASAKSEGVFVLWKIFPHGIFELPAIFISLGMGLKLWTFIFKKNKIETLKVYLAKSLMVFLLIVIPLLIIAAIIEGGLIFLLG